jgi:hypothetical protein
MKEYLDIINSSFIARNEKLKYKILYTDFPDLETMDKCYDIFKKAENLTKGNQIIQQRIVRARMPLDHMRLLRYKLFKKIADGKKHPAIIEDYPTECENFIAKAKQFGRRRYSECQEAETHEAYLRSIGRVEVPLPTAFGSIPEKNFLDVQDNMFILIGTRNGWVKNVKDPNASDKFAAFMPGTHTQWSVQLSTSKDFLKICSGKWRCFISARIDATPDKTGKLSLGVYDAPNQNSVIQIDAELPNTKEYHLFDLGSYNFKPGMYVWAAPGSKDKKGGVYIDRMFFIKENQ